MGLFDSLLDIAMSPVKVTAQVVKTTLDVADVVAKPVAGIAKEVTEEVCETLKDLTK